MRIVGRRAANRRIVIDLVGQREGEGAVAIDVQSEDRALDTALTVRDCHAPDIVRTMQLPDDLVADRGDLHAVLGEDRCAVRAIVDEEREGTTAGNQAGDVAAELLLRDRKIAVDVLVIARRRAEIVALDVVGVLVAVAGRGIKFRILLPDDVKLFFLDNELQMAADHRSVQSPPRGPAPR